MADAANFPCACLPCQQAAMTNGPARTREAQADTLASLARPLADDTTPGSVERQCQASAESAVNDQPESDTGAPGVGGWTVVVPAVVPACLAVPVP